MKYFEDLTVGAKTELGSHTFEAEEIRSFNDKYDSGIPLIYDCDDVPSNIDKLVASGWHTAAIGMRLTVDGTRRENPNLRGDIVKTGPSPGARDLKWLWPVVVGDTVTYATEIVELRDVSRPDWGLMVTKTYGTNQNGKTVYSVQGAVFVARKPK